MTILGLVYLLNLQRYGILTTDRVGSCRRDLLDHLIVVNEAHLRRLILDYVSYYHDDRTHDSLQKDTPAMRPVSSKPNPSAAVLSFPRVGGLHHRYDWRQAA
jgi:putative transposase